MTWIQVRDVHAEPARLAAAGIPVIGEPATKPWGLIETWIEDPDGIPIVLVEVPADPLSVVTAIGFVTKMTTDMRHVRAFSVWSASA